MNCGECIALVAVLGAICLAGWVFIAALGLVLSQLDRRRYVRQLHRMRRP